jgi:hypothetical protein
MANFNVTLNVSAGKGGSANFSATSGYGLYSGYPLQVNAGDTVTFICGSGSSGTARFRYLSIFTNNANIDILTGGANVVRTVASGGLLLDEITGLNGGQLASDLFYIKRLASSSSSDTTPNAFSFTDKTGNVSTEQNSFVQITGIDAATTVSRTSGTATFAVVGTSSTPSAGNFGTSSTTITNNQYLHVKQTTSSSYSTSLSTVMNVGGVTDTWTTTSNAAAAPPAAPTNLSFVTLTTASNLTNVLATASGGGTGTLKVSADGITWYANGTSFGSRTRGTAHTWYARVESSLNSSNYTEAHTPPYLSPATGTAANDTILTGGSSHTGSISGGSSGTVYEFRSGGYTGTILATVNGNGTAPCSGGVGTYYVTRYKTTGTGGSGTAGRANLTTYTV